MLSATSWWNFVRVGALTTGATLLAAYAVILALDPFGRLGLSTGNRVAYDDERPAIASRAIDPQFNSAIIGNSTSIPLMPENLDRLTG